MSNRLIDYIKLFRSPFRQIPVSDVYIDNYYNPFGKRSEYQKGVQTTVEFICNVDDLPEDIFKYLYLIGSNQVQGSWNDKFCKFYNTELGGNSIGYLVTGDDTYILSDIITNFEFMKEPGEPELLKLAIRGKLKVQPYKVEPMKFDFGRYHVAYNPAIFNTDNYGITLVESEEDNNMESKCYKFSDGFKSKTLKQIVINEEEGIVTAITNNYEGKVVTLAKTAKGDEFDPYVGAALALAYQLFGSKTQFRKYVDEKAKKLSDIKEKKAKAKENGKKVAAK